MRIDRRNVMLPIDSLPLLSFVLASEVVEEGVERCRLRGSLAGRGLRYPVQQARGITLTRMRITQHAACDTRREAHSRSRHAFGRFAARLSGNNNRVHPVIR